MNGILFLEGDTSISRAVEEEKDEMKESSPAAEELSLDGIMHVKREQSVFSNRCAKWQTYGLTLSLEGAFFGLTRTRHCWKAH
jgi:hypothetical protein